MDDTEMTDYTGTEDEEGSDEDEDEEKDKDKEEDSELDTSTGKGAKSKKRKVSLDKGAAKKKVDSRLKVENILVLKDATGGCFNTFNAGLSLLITPKAGSNLKSMEHYAIIEVKLIWVLNRSHIGQNLNNLFL